MFFQPGMFVLKRVEARDKRPLFHLFNQLFVGQCHQKITFNLMYPELFQV